MKENFIFTNLAGSFIFDSQNKIVDKILFKELKDYNDKEKYEKKLLLKYPDSKKPGKGDLKKILSFFKDKKYLNEFYIKNLDLTRTRIRESVTEDQYIIQTINNIEDINKVINTLSKRLRDWYELYNPEFSLSIEDHEKFSELIIIKSKKQLLKEIKVAEDSSMGADLKKEDLAPIFRLAKEVQQLFEIRKKQEAYLDKLMNKCCANIKEIAGTLIAAKLVEHAGSLERLAELPASTVQLLGAEKALFRHMRTGARCPKYGVIFAHPFISKVGKDKQGKMARTLADKISIAAKVDFFKGKFIGDKLKKQIEAKFK